MLVHEKALLFCALAVAGAGPPALADEVVYDTTLGTYLDYDGDLDGGVLNMRDFDGNSFRVQRLDMETELGTYGVGGALLDMQVELLGFTDVGAPGYGAGDVAAFQGVPGRDFDFTITDEFGETITGSIGLLELSDRTNSLVLPGIEGQAILGDLVFSGNTFQGIPINGNLTTGTFYVFVEATGGWDTLGEMLEEGGAGPQLTLEIRLIPAPATAAPLAVAAVGLRRRRRA